MDSNNQNPQKLEEDLQKLSGEVKTETSTRPAPPIMHEIPKPKSKLLPILITLLFLIGFSSLGYWAYQNYFVQNTPVATTTPTPTPTPDSTTNWKTIKRKHWEFKVPSDWHYLECGNELVFVGPKIDTDKTIECAFDSSPGVVQVSRTPGQNKRKIPTNTDPKLDPYVSNKTLVVIDGQNAIQQQENISDGPGQGTRIYVYFEKPEYTDVIILHDITQKVIFDQILSTLKFLEATPTPTSTARPSATPM